MMVNTQKIKQALMTSIFEVFEKMFYVFLEPVDKTNWNPESAVSIRFTGPMKGMIRAHYSKELTYVMAQNMLNIDESEITEKLREDCLMESINMICGNFLRNFDSSKVFDLSIPVCEPVDDKNTGGPVESSEQNLLLDFTSGNGMVGIICAISDNE